MIEIIDIKDGHYWMAWIREGSIQKTVRNVIADGWDIYGAPGSKGELRFVMFSVIGLYMSATNEWIGDRTKAMARAESSRSMAELKASDIELGPHAEANFIGIADQIIFDKMWPRYVRLLKSKKIGYSERTVKL